MLYQMLTSRLLLVSATAFFAASSVGFAPQRKLAPLDPTLPSRVFGTIVNFKDVPAASITVRLEQMGGIQHGGGGGSGAHRGKVAGGEQPRNLFQSGLQVMTDSKGVYEFKALPVGTYQLIAGDFHTVGMVGEVIHVTGDGKPIQKDLKLEEPAGN